MSDERRRRPPIVGPVILIGIGVLALMQNFGQLPVNFWQTVWRVWPVILVLIGVEILLGQLRLPWGLSFLLALALIAGTIYGVVYLAQQAGWEDRLGAGEMRYIEKDLDGATSATVNLKYGAGSLTVGAGDATHIMVGDFLEANGRVQARVDYSTSGGRGKLEISVPDSQAFIFVSGKSNEWNVKLNTAVPLDVRIDAGASTNNLDLSDLKLSGLRVQAGVSTNTIRLPRTGDYTARLTGGLSTTTVYVPEGVAARIMVDGGLSSVSVDENRFVRSGNAYVSPGYETATNRVRLDIEGGLSTISVR
jgi:hypothetical protein